MRPEVRAWVEGIVAEYRPQGPVLEVGAYNVNGTIRDLFPQEGYVGLDKSPGPDVDMVVDICNLKSAKKYATVICCETLEHVTEPWTAIERMYAALRAGGLFIATWCFVFPIHEYPEDYWRATPAGFRYLLERVGFSDIRIDTEGEGPVGVFAVARKA